MKQIALGIFMGILATTTFAQADAKTKQQRQELSPTERAAKVSDRLQSELVLSKEIRDKVYELNVAKFSQLAEAKNAYNTDKDAAKYKEQSKVIRDTYLQTLEKTLTPDQFQKLKEKSASKKMERGTNNKKKLQTTEPTDVDM